MRLKNPAAIWAAIQMLKTLALTVRNYASGPGWEAARDTWLQWADNAEAQSRGLFADTDLADMLFRTQLEMQRLAEHAQPWRFIGHESTSGNLGSTTQPAI